MTTSHASDFIAAEFAELRSITAELRHKWFPEHEGVRPADLSAVARLAFDLERLVAGVANRRQAQAA